MPKYKFSEIAYNITDKKMPEPGDEELYIGLEHLDSGSLRVTRWGSEVELVGQKLVMQKGDILFGRRNTYLRRAAIAPHDGIFSAHGMIFRPNTAVIDPDYFPFFISSDYFMDAAIRISVGSLSPTVNWKTLKELEFFLPDLNQQRHTAELLSAANETKEAYQDLLIRSDELVKSQFIELFGDPIINPRRLPTKKLSELATLITKGASPTWQGYNYTDDPTQTLFVTSENVREGSLDLSEPKYLEDGFNDKQARSVLKKGDFLINIVGASIGRAARFDLDVKANINQAVALVRMTDEVVTSEYMMYYLNSPKALEMYEAMKSAVARANLSLQNISDLEILIPSKDEQIAFSEFLTQSDKSKYVAYQLTLFLNKFAKYELQSLFQEECICSLKM